MARSVHTATLLPNGQVVVAGGYNGTAYLNSAEIYEPGTGNWSFTGPLTTGRSQQTATLLPNGKVLVVGGYNGTACLNSAELYDPATGKWTPTGSLAAARSNHTATLLPNGKVLVAGGYNGTTYLSSAELYDPGSGVWSTTGSFIFPCAFHTATLLASGKVLLAGGYQELENPAGFGIARMGAFIYDPTAGTWEATGNLNWGRYRHTATLLPNGQVLAAQGNSDNAMTTFDLYDPVSGTWTVKDFLGSYYYCYQRTATLLPNGQVLLTGGFDRSSFLSGAALYNPALGFIGSWATRDPSPALAVRTQPPFCPAARL